MPLPPQPDERHIRPFAEFLAGHRRVLLDEAFGDVLAVVTEGMPETIPLLRGVPPIEASPSTGAAVFDSTVSDL